MDEKEFIEWLRKENLLRSIKRYLPVYKQAIRASLNPKKKETILVIGDIGRPYRRTPAMVLASYLLASKDLGLDTRLAIQKQKIQGDAISENVIEKMLCLPDKSLLALSLSGKLGTGKPMGKSFRKYANMHKHRFISTPSLANFLTAGYKYLTQAININLGELQRRGARLKRHLDQGDNVNITTRKGTDLVIGIKGKKSINNQGIYTEPGQGGNLPAGEVYIPPEPMKTEGTLFIDASIKTRRRCMIIKKPVKFKIEKGAITEITGGYPAKRLEKDLEEAASISKRPKNVWKIGELGIGTNPAAKVICPTIINEKSLGTAHVAIGSNAWFGGDIKSIIHLDQVFYEPIIRIDDKIIRIR